MDADKERRLIAHFQGRAHMLRSHLDVPGSTSETCTVLLALGRTDLLLSPYQAPTAAWQRIDHRQRRIVRDERPRFAQQMRKETGESWHWPLHQGGRSNA